MTNHPYYLMREVERIRADVRQVLDALAGDQGESWLDRPIARHIVSDALLKICGRLQGVEDHLSDKAFEAETRSVLSGDLPPLAEADPPQDLVDQVAALTARQRREIFDLLNEGLFIDTNGVGVAFAPKGVPGLVRKPAN